MAQDLDQALLLIGAVLGGGFALIFLLAWLEPPRPGVPVPVRERPALRVRTARVISTLSGTGSGAAADLSGLVTQEPAVAPDRTLSGVEPAAA